MLDFINANTVINVRLNIKVLGSSKLSITSQILIAVTVWLNYSSIYPLYVGLCPFLKLL